MNNYAPCPMPPSHCFTLWCWYTFRCFAEQCMCQCSMCCIFREEKKRVSASVVRNNKTNNAAELPCHLVTASPYGVVTRTFGCFAEQCMLWLCMCCTIREKEEKKKSSPRLKFPKYAFTSARSFNVGREQSGYKYQSPRRFLRSLLP
jgi:hypothetical protein